MPIETHYNDNGVWRKMSEIHYYDGSLGDWREISDAYYNDQGTCRQVFTNRAVSLDNKTVQSSRDTSGGSGTATAAYILTTDGRAREEVNQTQFTDSTITQDLSGDNWWTGKPQASVGDDFEVRATQTGGNAFGTFTGTLDTWEAITVDREWELTVTGAFTEITATRTLLIEIRDAATQTVRDSATITIRALLFGAQLFIFLYPILNGMV